MVGPGTVLLRYLSNKGIKTTAGCSCTQLAKNMNLAGSDKVEISIEKWTDDMVVSARQWRKLSNKMWAKFICPPRMIVKRTILWACQESNRLNQKEIPNG